MLKRPISPLNLSMLALSALLLAAISLFACVGTLRNGESATSLQPAAQNVMAVALDGLAPQSARYDMGNPTYTDIWVGPSGSDGLQCEQCEHVLLRNMTIRSIRATTAQNETLKVNQSTYIFVEDNDIGGAGNSANALDFVSVQHAHIVGNRFHDTGDWCAYVKGGSAYILFEDNEIDHCYTGGFTAGEGSSYQFMRAPYLHYEAYDVKFVNNLIHDVDGVACVLIGSNDLWYLYNNGGETTGAQESADLTNYSNNIDAILSQLRATGATVLIGLVDDQSLRPVAADPARRAVTFPDVSVNELTLMSAQARRYNEVIRARATQHGAVVVDFFNTTIFTDPATVGDDGNHQNAAGYDAMTALWFNAIRR